MGLEDVPRDSLGAQACAQGGYSICRFAWEHVPRRTAALVDMSPDLEGCAFDYEGIVLGVGDVLSAGTAETSALKGLAYCIFMEPSSAGSVQAPWSGSSAQGIVV